jgi:CheY-like chemotaxis protein
MAGAEHERFRVLVVDDEPDLVEFVSEVLQSAGCSVCSAANGDDALSEAMSFHPQLIFLDIIIPEQDGWLVCSKLKMLKPAPTIVLVTGLRQEESGRFANFVHADELLHKPFTDDDLLRSLEKARSPE